MKEEPLNWKAEPFFAKDWKYLFFGTILVLLIVAWEIYSINSRMDSFKKTVVEDNGKFVNAAEKIANTPFRAEYLKEYIMPVFANNFIVSRAQFIGNSFKNRDDILANSKTLRMAQKYLNNSSIQANRDFTNYLQWLLNAVNEDKLPEYITIKDYSYIGGSYDYNGNRFWANFNVAVTALSWSVAQVRDVRHDGMIKVSANGTFDLGSSSGNNPYGIKIDGFAINMITKGR
jgi:hypothetical protein